MDDSDSTARQAALGLERLCALLRAQAWQSRSGDTRLHPAQQALLEAVARERAGWRIGQLARHLGVSAASISDSVAALEARGLLLRMRDADDARATRVRATRSGIAQVRRASGSGAAGLVAALPARDAAALLRAVQLLVDQAQQDGIASGTRTCLGCRFFQPFASGDPARPHVCAFVGKPFGDAALRVDCAEQDPAEPAQLAANRDRFAAGGGSKAPR